MIDEMYGPFLKVMVLSLSVLLLGSMILLGAASSEEVRSDPELTAGSQYLSGSYHPTRGLNNKRQGRSSVDTSDLVPDVRWSISEDDLYCADSHFVGDPVLDDEENIYIGTSADCLYKFNSDGEKQWRVELNNNLFYHSPSIASNGNILLTMLTDIAEVDSDGNIVWQESLGGTTAETTSHAGAIAEDDTFIFRTRGHTIYSYHTVASSGTAGTVAWSIDRSWSASGQRETGPVIADDGTIYFGLQGESSPDDSPFLEAINPDGTVKWDLGLDVGWGLRGMPVIYQGTIYAVPEGGRAVYRVEDDGSSGSYTRISYSQYRNHDVRGARAVASDGLLYLPDESDGLYAYETQYTSGSAGDVRWSSESFSVNPESSPVIADDGTIYIGGDDKLAAINSDGSTRWMWNDGGKLGENNPLTSPVIGGGGTIYVHDENHLYAVKNVVDTDSATDVGFDQATLNGESFEDTADVNFQYRVQGDSTWSETSVQSLSVVQTYSEIVSGLESDTTYEFRARSVTTEYGTQYGDTLTFTTDNMADVTTHPASSVSINSATLEGEVTNLNVPEVDVYFEHREDGDLSWDETNKMSVSSATSFSSPLDGLSGGTTYEYRAVAVDSGGNRTEGGVVSYVTEEIAQMTTQTATDVGSYDATVHGEVDSIHSSIDNIIVFFEYKKESEGSWSVTSDETFSTVGSIERKLTNLDPGTIYEFRVVAESGEEKTDGGVLEFYTGELKELTVNTDGNGSVDVSGHQYYADGVYKFIPNYTAELQAIPHRYRTFVNWTGDYESEDENMSFVMDVDKTVFASFSDPLYPLNIDVIGDGVVHVDPDVENRTYEPGTEVNLTAEVTNDEYFFRQYYGDYSSYDEVVTIIMDSEMNITVEFSYQGDYGYIPSDDTSSSGLMEFVNSEILVLLVASVFVVIGIVQARRDGSL